VREIGGRTRDRKDDIDALAAAVLLQHALRMHALAAVDPDEASPDGATSR
jgi:RNase H-fold protein (predicted Holliday junction resolvase)